jgi:hypothetical protein
MVEMRDGYLPNSFDMRLSLELRKQEKRDQNMEPSGGINARTEGNSCEYFAGIE